MYAKSADFPDDRLPIIEQRLLLNSISLGKSLAPENFTFDICLYGSFSSGFTAWIFTRSAGSISVWSSPSNVGLALIHVASLCVLPSTNLPKHLVRSSKLCASQQAYTGFCLISC